MIYIVSFPKSGRTWFRTILQEYETRSSSVSKKHLFTHIGYGYGKDANARNSIKNKAYEAIILLARDPSDTFVSYYHDYVKRGPNTLDGTIDEYCVSKIADYNQYVSEIQEHEFDVTMEYESMMDDTIGAILPTFDLLFDEVDMDALQDAVDFCSFQNLYTLEREGTIDMRRKIDGFYKTRKGKVGSAKEELKEETLEKIEGQCKRITL